MSDSILPPEAPGGPDATEPVDPAFEQRFAASLHEHAHSVIGSGDPSALSARLARHDEVMTRRKIALAGGAVMVLLVGLLALGASRRDSPVVTAAGPSATAVAVPGRTTPGGDAGDPIDSTSNGTVDGSSGSTSDVSIPLPGEVEPDGSTSTPTSASPTPGGVTTSAPPGAPSTSRPGSPTTTGPAPSTNPTGPPPNPTTGPTVAPTGPPTSGPVSTTPITLPTTTIDPAQRCSARQVNTVLRQSASTAGVLFADFDQGLAPPGSTLRVSSDDSATRRLILSTTKVANPDGSWAWNVQWNASGTPRAVDLHFYIECSNRTRLAFTVRRAT